MNKKALLSAVLVGASALYLLARTPAEATAVGASAPIAAGAGSAGNTATPPPTTSAPSAPSAPAALPTPAAATPKPAPAPKPAATGQYKDGTYTGSTADAFYGYVQVKATVSGGKLTDVTFLQYPDTHSTSVYINSQAMPYLTQEALAVQSANVNIISGATDTSLAFRQSLSSALAQAANS